MCLNVVHTVLGAYRLGATREKKLWLLIFEIFTNVEDGNSDRQSVGS